MRAISTVLARLSSSCNAATAAVNHTHAQEGLYIMDRSAEPNPCQPARGEGEAAWLQPENYLRRRSNARTQESGQES